MSLYLLFESAAGFALFEKQEFDEVNTKLPQVQKAISNMESFSAILRLKAFSAFVSAEQAISNMVALKDGTITQDLQNFLESNLPAKKKKTAFKLAILDNKLASNVAKTFQIECIFNDVMFELFRGIRQHFTKFIKSKDFNEQTLVRAELGLAHSFSRNNVSFDVNRQDKHIIQAIAIVEQMDKNLNQFTMRVKEWFSWHFPEMAKIVTDNEMFVRCVHLIQNRDYENENLLEEIEEIVHDGEIAQRVIDAQKISMGQEFSEVDTKHLHELSSKVVAQFEFKKEIQQYLQDRMRIVAPNLTSLIGENVAAKLISQAGSLTTLAKYPASTVQILGAEKALFRALKTKGNTPKYGTLFHSGFIGRAAAKDKGKISRYLANKCSLAARCDNFLVKPSNKFGERMKKQVEDRLQFLDDGKATDKNIDVMEEIVNELKLENLYVDTENQKKKKSKQNKKQVEEEEQPEKKSKKDKKKKQQVEESQEEPEEPVVKKKKKKSA